jgi:prepilin-type N-terminal cleavage/methylation domain-containing protein
MQAFNQQSKSAFTLIELLIVVAILGIISTIGVIMMGDIIGNTKEKTAQNSLKSISMLQADYYAENSQYLTTNVGDAQQINQNLFNGSKTLDEKSDYAYSIKANGVGFRAYAKPKKSNSGLKDYCLDHNDVLSTSC